LVYIVSQLLFTIYDYFYLCFCLPFLSPIKYDVRLPSPS